MQIHELNNFSGTLGAGSYVAVDNGTDTGKVSTAAILADTETEISTLDTTLNARIDNIISGVTVNSEVIDARLGADGVTYGTLGTAIRTQFTDVKDEIESLSLYKIEFESGFYNDNGFKQSYPRRLRSCSKVALGSFTKIEFPDGYKGYALVYDEKGTKLGFYGYNSGNFTASIYSSYVKANKANAYSIGINVAKNDTPTGDISSFKEYVSTNTNVIPREAIGGINYTIADAASASAIMNSDVNNLPSQSIAFIAISSSISNLPTPSFNGSILTYVPAIFNETAKVQIAVQTNNAADVYKRIKTNNGWTSWSKLVNDNNVALLTYGTQIASGTDLLSLSDIGTYYSPSKSVSETLSNCPTSKAFKMTIEYSTGNDANWLLYKLTDSSGGVFVNAVQNGSFIGWTSETAPGLTYSQKMMLRDLFLEYINNRTVFYYDYDVMRDAYADGDNIFTDATEVVELFPDAASVSADGFFKLNCSSFIQMILMGRDVSDFVGKNAQTYSSNITLYEHPTYGTFEFGYYFDFLDRTKCYAKGIEDGQGNIIGLYGYNDKAKEPYAYNTRYSTSNTTGLMDGDEPLNQSWLLYETASDMALELYRKGCEIKLSELQVGDLVFTKPVYTEEDSFSATSFRGIGHVAMVIGFNADGLPNFGESGLLFPTVVRSGYNYEATSDVLHAQAIIRNVAMCARHPYAFGHSSNVPQRIESLI